MTDPSDPPISMLLAGNRATRERLLVRTGEQLRRLASAMLRPNDRLRHYADSDDLLQGALLRLLKALDTVELTDSAQFFRLASEQMRRELLDLARHYFGPQGAGTREIPLVCPTDDDPGHDCRQSTYDPGRLAHWGEFHEQVQRLDPDERTVFDLLYYQSLTQEEAAEVLNVSVPTVKRRWLAARLRLQSWIQQAQA